MDRKFVQCLQVLGLTDTRAIEDGRIAVGTGGKDDLLLGMESGLVARIVNTIDALGHVFVAVFLKDDLVNGGVVSERMGQ